MVEPHPIDGADVHARGRADEAVVEGPVPRPEGQAQAHAGVVRDCAVDHRHVSPARDGDTVTIPVGNDILDPTPVDVGETDSVGGSAGADPAHDRVGGVLDHQRRRASAEAQVGDLGPFPAGDRYGELARSGVDRRLAIARPAQAHAGRQSDAARERPRGQGDDVPRFRLGDRLLERPTRRRRDRIGGRVARGPGRDQDEPRREPRGPRSTFGPPARFGWAHG